MSEKLEVKYIPLSQAVLLEINPKKHDMGGLIELIKLHGFKDPPKWEPQLNNGNGGIVEGNGRIEALSVMYGMKEDKPRGILVNSETNEWLVPVLFGVNSESEQAALAYSISHNVSTMAGGDFELSDYLKLYDQEEFIDLAINLAEQDFYALPFDGDDIDSLKAIRESWFKDNQQVTEEDDSEDLDELESDISELDNTLSESEIKSRVNKGELWQVRAADSTHLIMCGDCRDFADVYKLIGQREVNLVFTSPPYASQRKYDESSGFKPIKPNEYLTWFKSVQLNLHKFLAKDGSYFLNIKSHVEEGKRNLYVNKLVIAHAEDWHWHFIDEFCWTKSGMPGSWKNRFKNGWEPVFHFALTDDIKFRPDNVLRKPEGGKAKVKFDAVKDNVNSDYWFHSNDSKELEGALPSNVISVNSMALDNKVLGNKKLGHAAPFPVALPDFFIRAFSDVNDWVFEPFAGSGTVAIASHRNRRNSLNMEISPGYCNYILTRLEKETGSKAELVN
jgi:site-specific DNA-methyltransferase (adenine-specific)/site-specific DNA-methyltransferase (cytosine-N4-specific)